MPGPKQLMWQAPSPAVARPLPIGTEEEDVPAANVSMQDPAWAALGEPLDKDWEDEEEAADEEGDTKEAEPSRKESSPTPAVDEGVAPPPSSAAPPVGPPDIAAALARRPAFIGACGRRPPSCPPK